MDAVLFSVMGNYDAAIMERIMEFISLSAFPIFAASAMFFGGRMKAVDYVAVMATTISFSVFFQQFFARPRPEGAILRGLDGPYSFPSTHSSSAFAWASCMGKNFRKLAIIFYVFAALVAVSRVYVGVHYPVDVAAGAILGSAISRFVTRKNGIRKSGKPR